MGRIEITYETLTRIGGVDGAGNVIAAELVGVYSELDINLGGSPISRRVKVCSNSINTAVHTYTNVFGKEIKGFEILDQGNKPLSRQVLFGGHVFVERVERRKS